MTFDEIFTDSFDTFKVFNSLDVSKASFQSANSPKSIWQILNHLIVWQDFQLFKLKGSDLRTIDERDTWTTSPAIQDQELLQRTVDIFNNQIKQIKFEISLLTIDSNNIQNKLKIVQDLSLHLSFHLGEMILQLRQNGFYPMPSEMKEFLAD